jgi:RNA polymerase sigma-70 factor (ECF subfamily)
LFDFESQFSPNGSAKITASRQVNQQAEDVRRDIYDSHRHRTFALAFYMTGNELEAEQILTNTFVHAFRAAEEKSTEPQAQDVDQALVGELRQRFPLGENEPCAQLSRPRHTAGSDLDLGNRNIRRTDLEEAIQMLPPTERFMFLLRDDEGYTPATISQLLQLSETQVQRSLFSARIRLRQALVITQADRRAAA